MKFILIFLLLNIQIISNGQPIYTMNNNASAGIAAFSLMFSSVSLYKHHQLKRNPLSMDSIPEFRAPFFDRSALKQYSKTADALSDISLTFCALLPAAIMINPGSQLHRSTYGIMLLENAAFTLSFTSLVKTSAQRYRPYVYNPEISPDIKSKPDARYSFFSGHTALSFCSATMFFTTYARLYPNSSRKYTYGAISFGLASTTGVLRYLSGKHYPSDIIIGALVGIGGGWLITRVHSQ